jgi:CheY-like chemotaxis protein
VVRILVVEDDPMSRDLLSRRLARQGFAVSLAEDGQAALAATAAAAPDLILMDLDLPVLDGWEATRRIKAEPATRRIPVIALTAHAMTGDREKAARAGCDDYDTKPVDFPRLLGKIRALLSAGGGPA